MFLILVLVLFAGYGTAYLVSEDVRYLTRAGIEETRILQNRRPIEKILADSALPPETRASLRLVLDARDYAADLGLEAKETYTTYTDVERDTLLLVLSASPPDCLCPYIWKYPVIGRIPYKGFFDLAMAQRTAAKLERQGYDVYLRPAAAFSTLGWFNDPLLSTAMSPDPVELAALVFHEIAHNTLYVKSATPFNESFAQAVGYLAAERFFRDRGDSAAAARAADRWHDEQLLGRYYTDLSARLDSLYHGSHDSASVRAGRAEAGRWARERLTALAPDFRSFRLGPVADRPVNNARLISARIYRTRLDLFAWWFQREERDVAAMVATLQTLLRGAEGDEAFRRMEQAMVQAASPAD